MAVIDIKVFGGIAPSVDPRELGPERAQTASNLELRHGDFRPIKGPGASVTTVTSGALALHRAPGGTWLHATGDADFVNGQVNDTTDARVYVTGHAAYPEAWNGSYRRLGVRAPTAAPTVALNEQEEFDTVERGVALTTAVKAIRDAVLANVTALLLGNGLPVDTALGSEWFAHGDVNVTGMPTTDGTQIVYAIPLTAGAATNVSDQYLMNPLLHGAAVTYASASYWAVPLVWQPYGYDVDEAALSTAIQALLKPPENVDPLVPVAIANQIAARIAAIADPTKDPLAILVANVNVAQGDIITSNLRELDDTQRVYAMSALLARLENAVRAVDSYFLAWETQLGIILGDYEYLMPVAVERVYETRAYVYTYVTDWGEESAPSPESVLLTLDQNDFADITVVAPPASATYGATSYWRLYRSATTNQGAAYEFVVEQAIGDLTYTDEKLQEELGPDVCQTMTWTEPRSDMLGLCGGANGIMLGFVGKILCACEAYTPYAWPREFEHALQHNIVAIGWTGQSWVVATEGDTYLVSGADPAQLSEQQLARPQACVSKRSLQSVAGGVLFASPDGVCLADASGVTLLTVGAYDKTDWAALTPSASFAAFSEGVYHLWLTTASKLLTLDFARVSMTLTTASGASAAYTDMLTDTMYTVVSTTVLPMLSGSAQEGVWKSGVYTFNEQPSFAWARVNGPFTSGSLAVYADGATVRTVTVSANTPVRLPDTRGREWSLQWTDTERAVRITLASSSAELAASGN